MYTIFTDPVDLEVLLNDARSAAESYEDGNPTHDPDRMAGIALEIARLHDQLLDALEPLKEALRDVASKAKALDGVVELTGFDDKGLLLGLVTVTFPSDRVKLSPRADIERLRRTLGDHFSDYFDDSTGNALIRLDEVRWGGVRRDGIPPLDRPRMIPAQEAHYLEPEHVVFGLERNGDARAYPKRILAWHELFKDTVGGVPVTGVYCTLCGSMIVYRSEHAGVHHDLGTSGFLYRSNKLMYDRATESLWSTLRGMPVIGPLAGKDIQLEPLAVVTSTWGVWSKRHPDGSVLSLETGHRRDYAEGAAYWRYFASDELMFEVPKRDDRLANKAEVLALRFGPAAPPTAIDLERLERASIYHGALGETPYVILTDDSGASRVYASRGVRFEAYDRSLTATDSEGLTWTLREDALAGKDGARLERLPAHRAFWFGWYAAHPDTILIR